MKKESLLSRLETMKRMAETSTEFTSLDVVLILLEYIGNEEITNAVENLPFI